MEQKSDFICGKCGAGSNFGDPAHACKSEALSIQRGRTYRAKSPRRAGAFNDLVNDRTILAINASLVQYDSPSVACGRRYPTISIEKFESWAARDVTDELPKGEYAKWPEEGKPK